MLAGDFNFAVHGEEPIRLGYKGAAQPTVQNRYLIASRQRAWAPIYNLCAEMHQEEPTRLGKTSNKNDDQYWIATRLDRIYIYLVGPVAVLPVKLPHLSLLTWH